MIVDNTCISAARVVTRYHELLAQLDCDLHISSDFVQMRSAAESMGDVVQPHFDPDHNTFFQGEAFWVGAYKEDRCVGMTACKKQPIGNENLFDYIKRYWARTYKPGSENEIEFAKQQKRRLKAITGKIVYAGDYRVHREFRKTHLGEYLLNLTKLLVFREWAETDHIYLFTRAKHARIGMFEKTGMATHIPRAINWIQHPSQAQADYWMGLMGQDDFLDWLDDEVQQLEQPGSKAS